MKKSLWIVAAAMVLGQGLSAHAVTNAVYGQWSFESLAVETSIPSSDDPTPLADPYGTWSADTNNGVAFISNVTVTVPNYPIPAAAHDKTLYFDGSVTNHFDITALDGQAFYTDFLLKPGQLEDLSLLGQVDSEARLAFFFDTNGLFNLLCGDAFGNWMTNTFASPSYGSNDWVRITLNQDYAVVVNSRAAFSVWINGTNLTHANGYTRTGNSFASGGGVWFEMKDSTSGPEESPSYGMNALVGMGIGMLDDVVNRTDSPFGSFSTIEVFASAPAHFGAISPAGTVVITDGTPQTFTLTVSNGVAAYVSGLKLNTTQVYTNTDQGVKTQQWAVSYAMATASGTNVIAMFASKSGTTYDWVDDSFTIGGEGADYATYAEALADDYDNDGFTNGDEGIAGTDPKNGADYLRISDITVIGGQVVVTFTGSVDGAPGPYDLLEADTVGGTYSNVTTRVKEDGTLSTTNNPAVQPKFYKVVVPYAGE